MTDLKLSVLLFVEISIREEQNDFLELTNIFHIQQETIDEFCIRAIFIQ